MADLKKRAGVIKTRITKNINKYDSLGEELETSSVKYFVDVLTGAIEEIKPIFEQICLESASVPKDDTGLESASITKEEDNPELDMIMEGQTDYLYQLNCKLSSMKALLVSDPPQTLPITSMSTNPDNNYSFKFPKICVPNFSDNKDDPCAFYHFKNALNNAFDSMPNIADSQKLSYLKTLLRGKAFSLIESMAVVDKSYAVAVRLLEKEFLDTDLIIHQILHKIRSYPSANDLSDAEELVSFLRFKLVDLQKFELDFTLEGSPGNLLLSDIVRDKLPKFFLTELSRSSKNAYPKVNDLLEHASDLFKILSNKNSYRTVNKAKTDQAGAISKSSNSKGNLPSNKTVLNASPSLTSKVCKFCSENSHSSSACNQYPSVNSRVQRARSLSLCVRCLSAKHSEDSCPGKESKLPFVCNICKSTAHAKPMCPQMKDKKSQ